MTDREMFYDDEHTVHATPTDARMIAKAILAVGRYLGAELGRIGDELQKRNDRDSAAFRDMIARD